MMTDIGLDRGNSSILVSGDDSGVFMIWDIRTAKVLHYFGFFI
jgi:WD40 repeat protein